MQHLDGSQSSRLVGDGGGDLGASLVEYALIVALVVVGLISAVQFMGDNTENRYDERWGCEGGVDQYDDYGGATATTAVCPP